MNQRSWSIDFHQPPASPILTPLPPRGIKDKEGLGDDQPSWSKCHLLSPILCPLHLVPSLLRMIWIAKQSKGRCMGWKSKIFKGHCFGPIDQSIQWHCFVRPMKIFDFQSTGPMLKDGTKADHSFLLCILFHPLSPIDQSVQWHCPSTPLPLYPLGVSGVLGVRMGPLQY